MNERLTTWMPLLLLAFLAALTFWLDRAVQPPALTRDVAARHDPDYVVEKLTALRMDPAGRVRQTLYAEKMTHYPDDDTTFLERPRLVAHNVGKAPVTISSREALVSGDGESVHFRHDVRVVRAPFQNASEMVMTTSYLNVIPDQDIARTDQPVRITDANTVVDAVGLELNSDTRVLKLQSRVRGTYHDPKKQSSTRQTP